MKAHIIKKPAHERFSGLREGDTLDPFEWFEIMPCKTSSEGEGVGQCAAEEAEFWTIYGRRNVGAGDAPEYLATAIHDEVLAVSIVRIAKQIVEETGKGFVAGCGVKGQYPRHNGRVVPFHDFFVLAEALTMAILDDIEAETPEEERRVDDFDNHPLTFLREAFVEFSNYSDTEERDPYTRRMIERCKDCHSDDIRVDAVAEWDSEAGEYALVDTYDTAYCNGECNGDECSTSFFDADTDEELKRGPSSPEYLPKAEADKQWEAYSKKRQKEAEDRRRQSQEQAKLDAIAAVLGEAYEEIEA